jgi:hypothetical protein
MLNVTYCIKGNRIPVFDYVSIKQTNEVLDKQQCCFLLDNL